MIDTRRAVTLADIGVAYELLGNRDKELDYDGQALPLLQKVGDLRDESITLNNMADISIARGEKQKALDLLRQSLALAQQAGSVDGAGGHAGDPRDRLRKIGEQG